ncbi:carbohydrate ABC transporter permease [Shouchella clausii]|uniref:carbohydrate ABC transporter permease n=1 Tax=Shouchella TaxID=2893057 RepID=UPI0004E605DA|nr:MULTISPECIES: carbohydrate ABC transporter permease [Shouchella]ALA53501.1 ABC-type sugar transport system, permease component [Shouchella clausii]MBU3229912.1 carbohydrate ABC transporter permease [Shouchella clausii]MBU3264004.1 carbohydrate ABC transporter permease [Shouchella clausii]MBU3506813.1 carbohydrate ABC transporter permease [Shouchella clausii]MBU3535178.1 carbohydrate ABC transporter permease [Shouchella clausii]
MKATLAERAATIGAGKKRGVWLSVLGKGLVGVFLLITVYPVIWLLLSSLKEPSEFMTNSMNALPEGFYLGNYVEAWKTGNMGIYFRNSIFVTFPALIGIVLFGSMAAFAIEKLRWKLKNVVMLLFLAGIMIPVQIVLLPLFQIYFNINLLNSLFGLGLVYLVFGLPLTIFLFASYFKSMPNELMEAAVVDGASIYQIFFTLALPLLKNAIVTVALVQFFFVWNDLIFAMSFIRDSDLRTIQTGLMGFAGEYGQREWGPTFASIALAVVPILLLYTFLNKLVMKGMTSGAVKG